MAKCRGPVNRLVMMRKRGMGPLLQNVGGGVCVKSVGNAYDVNGPLARTKAIRGWSDGVQCDGAGTIAVGFSGEVTWVLAGHPGVSITHDGAYSTPGTFTVSGPAGATSNALAYTGTWDNAPAPGDKISYVYTEAAGDYTDPNDDDAPIEDTAITVINCLDPTVSIGVAAGWTAGVDCAPVAVREFSEDFSGAFA